MLIIDYFCCKSKKYNLHCHHFLQKKRMMSKNIYFQMKKQAKKHQPRRSLLNDGVAFKVVFEKTGGHLLSHIALQYHRRKRA